MIMYRLTALLSFTVWCEPDCSLLGAACDSDGDRRVMEDLSGVCKVGGSTERNYI